MSWCVAERGVAYIYEHAYVYLQTNCIARFDDWGLFLQEVYGISLQLFGKARKIAESGECERDMIEHESSALEMAVNGFAANLDERRDILVQACTYYQNMEMVSTCMPPPLPPSLPPSLPLPLLLSFPP